MPPSSSKGFTLYYAVLFGGILVAIGASMLNLALKEFALSVTLRESEYAFSAADSGTECALYWDINGTNVFPVYNLAGSYRIYTGIPDQTQDPLANYSQVRCNGDVPVTISVIESGTEYATTKFNYDVDGSFCTTVTVKKQILDKGAPEERILTVVDARGNNFPCSTISNRKIERGFITQYPWVFE